MASTNPRIRSSSPQASSWYSPQKLGSSLVRFSGASVMNVFSEVRGLLISWARPAARMPSRSTRRTWARERRRSSTSFAFSDVAWVDGVAEDAGVAVGGDEHADRPAVELPQLAQELDTFDARHLLVGEHDGDGMLREPLEAGLCAVRRQDREVPPEGQLEDAQVVAFVVDVEHRILAMVHPARRLQ